MPQIIKDLNELKALASREEGCNCYISLMYGLRSSKHIAYDSDTWYVLNLSDSSEQELSDEGLAEDTNIIEALNKKALILDD